MNRVEQKPFHDPTDSPSTTELYFCFVLGLGIKMGAKGESVGVLSMEEDVYGLVLVKGSFSHAPS